MPELPDDYKPTEADLDMVIEEATSNPVKPTNLAAGIVSMRQRIAGLEAEKTQLLDRMDDDSSDSLTSHLASINQDLARAHERLIHYETQLGRQN